MVLVVARARGADDVEASIEQGEPIGRAGSAVRQAQGLVAIWPIGAEAVDGAEASQTSSSY